MSKALDELLTKLPLWVGQFTRTLTHPSQVLTEQLSADATAGASADAKPVQDGVGFLILSFAVAAGVAIAFPVASMHPMEPAADDGALARSAVVLRQLFVFLAATGVVHGSAKLLGNRQAFAGFFGAVARFGGVTLVLLALASALTNIGMADPVVARNWETLRQTAKHLDAPARLLLCQADLKTGQLPAGTRVEAPDSAALHQVQALYLETVSRPLVLLAAGLEGLILLAVMVWLAWVWWCYLRVSGLAPSRALAASAVGAAGLGAGYLLLMLIGSGQMLSALMQRCA